MPSTTTREPRRVELIYKTVGPRGQQRADDGSPEGSVGQNVEQKIEEATVKNRIGMDVVETPS